MPASTAVNRADVVVVGGGTVGAWTACLLAEAGRSVVLVEAATLGAGASSRAAGMVRAQGGTETAIRLGMFSRDFYRSQRDRFPLDSGFIEQGYLMPCFTADEVRAARERIALQDSLGLDVEWWDADALDARATGLAPGVALGASFAAGRRLPRRSPQRPCLYRRPRRLGRRRARALQVHRTARRPTASTPAKDSSPPTRWCSPAAPTWPRWDGPPAGASSPAAPATRSSRRHRCPVPIRPCCRWRSTWHQASTGVRVSAAGCCGE